MPLPHKIDDLGSGFDTETLKLHFTQNACPGIKYLHGIGAGLNLRTKIFSGKIGKQIKQSIKSFRFAIGEQTRRCLIRRSVTGNHIGCHGPGSPTEAQHRRFMGQCLPHPRNRLQHRRKVLQQSAAIQLRYSSRINGRHQGASTFFKANIAFESIGNHQYVGEQDSRIKTKSSYRLQRDFHSQFR